MTLAAMALRPASGPFDAGVDERAIVATAVRDLLAR
jgi:hypothetical protein